MKDDNKSAAGFSHEKIETNNFLMIILILLVIAVGGMVEIVPLFFQKSTTMPLEGVKPYGALQLADRAQPELRELRQHRRDAFHGVVPRSRYSLSAARSCTALGGEGSPV